MTRRHCLSLVLAGLATVGLGACGRRNQPEHPEGSVFPQRYPYAPPSANAASKPAVSAPTKGENSDTLRLETKTGYQR